VIVPISVRRKKLHENSPWYRNLHYEQGVKWLTGGGVGAGEVAAGRMGGGGEGGFEGGFDGGWFTAEELPYSTVAASRSLLGPVSCLFDSKLLNASIS
jgi:hypothetical protein